MLSNSDVTTTAHCTHLARDQICHRLPKIGGQEVRCSNSTEHPVIFQNKRLCTKQPFQNHPSGEKMEQNYISDALLKLETHKFMAYVN